MNWKWCAVALVTFATPGFSKPTLYFLAKASQGCEWKTWDLAKPKPEEMLKTPTCPEHAAWNFSEGKVYFAAGNVVSEAAWPRGTSASILTLKPRQWLQHLWISDETGRLRVVYLYPEGGGCKGDLQPYVWNWVCDGKQAQGVTGKLSVEELQTDRSWKKIATGDVGSAGGENLSLDSVKSHMNSSVTNFSAGCFLQGHSLYSTTLPCSLPEPREADDRSLASSDKNLQVVNGARIASGKNCEPVWRACAAEKKGKDYLDCQLDVACISSSDDLIRLFPVSKKEAFAIRYYSEGDSSKFAKPTFYCWDDCAKKKEVAFLGDRKFEEIDVRKAYIFLRSWGGQTVVFKFGEVKPIFDQEAVIAFLAPET